jgi:hypothetical protein
MWPSSTSLWKLAQEIDAAVETEATIRQDVYPLRLEVRRRVDDSDLTGLDEVVGD